MYMYMYMHICIPVMWTSVLRQTAWERVCWCSPSGSNRTSWTPPSLPSSLPFHRSLLPWQTALVFSAEVGRPQMQLGELRWGSCLRRFWGSPVEKSGFSPHTISRLFHWWRSAMLDRWSSCLAGSRRTQGTLPPSWRGRSWRLWRENRTAGSWGEGSLPSLSHGSTEGKYCSCTRMHK